MNRGAAQVLCKGKSTPIPALQSPTWQTKKEGKPVADQPIDLEKKEGIATITLNRPERLNSLTAAMVRELASAIDEVKKDPEMRVLVLTGAGRAFCAGEDVKERPGDSEEVRARQTPMDKLARGPASLMAFADTFRGMVKPTIASVNGFAVGQGLSIAMACDIRIASDNAQLGAIWTRRGIPPESAGAYLLTQLVGPAKACELIFAGKMIAAQEAKEIGLVNRVVPPDRLQAATHELARQIADGPPVAIGISKMLIYQALETSLAVHGRLEFFGQDYSFNTEDREEGIQSFLENRPARFRGR
jgi:2-(1,2-epoxy-1,2-dihydrophenyl)acetyl-CoA isomerase